MDQINKNSIRYNKVVWSESDSDSGGKSDFDDDFYLMKPIPKQYHKRDVVLISNKHTNNCSWADIVKKNGCEVENFYSKSVSLPLLKKAMHETGVNETVFNEIQCEKSEKSIQTDWSTTELNNEIYSENNSPETLSEIEFSSNNSDIHDISNQESVQNNFETNLDDEINWENIINELCPSSNDFNNSLYNDTNKIFDIREFAMKLNLNLMLKLKFLRTIIDSFPDDKFIIFGSCIYIRKVDDNEKKCKKKKAKNKRKTKLLPKNIKNCDADLVDRVYHLFFVMTMILFIRFMLNHMWNCLFGNI